MEAKQIGKAAATVTISAETTATYRKRLTVQGFETALDSRSNQYWNTLHVSGPCTSTVCQAAVFRSRHYQNVRECNNCHSSQEPETR